MILLPLVQLNSHFTISSDSTVPSLILRISIPRMSIDDIKSIIRTVFNEDLYYSWGYSSDSKLVLDCRTRHSTIGGISSIEHNLNEYVKPLLAAMDTMMDQSKSEYAEYIRLGIDPSTTIPQVDEDDEDEENYDDEDEEDEDDESNEEEVAPPPF